MGEAEHYCERCGHRLTRGHYTGAWVHWDEDDWYGGECPCAEEEAECIAVEREPRCPTCGRPRVEVSW